MSLNLNDVVTDGSAKFQVVKNATTNDIINAIDNFENKVGYRQKNKTYNMGDIAYHSDLPTGWYLECTTTGTSGSEELTISSPTIGGMVTDGTVVWTVSLNAASFTSIPNNQNIISAGFNSGAFVQLYREDASTSINQGAFKLNARKDSAGWTLRGGADGSLEWRDTNNNTVIYDLGNSAIVEKSIDGNGYIKYASGLIIQWSFGYANNDTTGYASNTFPISFTSSYRAIAMAVESSDATMNVVSTSSSTNSRLFLKTNYPGGIQIVYIAIGY